MGDLTERCAVRSHGGGGSGGDDGDEPTFVLERQDRGGLGLGVVQVSGATLTHGNGGGGHSPPTNQRHSNSSSNYSPDGCGNEGRKAGFSPKTSTRVCAVWCNAMNARPL